MIYQVMDNFTGEVVRSFRTEDAAKRYMKSYRKTLPVSERDDIFISESWEK